MVSCTSNVSQDKLAVPNTEMVFTKYQIPYLISHGWIEEIKPREFLLHFYGKQLAGVDELLDIERKELLYSHWATDRTIKVIEK